MDILQVLVVHNNCNMHYIIKGLVSLKNNFSSFERLEQVIFKKYNGFIDSQTEYLVNYIRRID